MANKQARYLRQHMTRQEVKLWVHLKTWRSDGFHFRRQAPREGYLLDFACLKYRLIVDVDGGGHGHRCQSLHNRKRDARLTNAGFRVLRFWNNEIDQNLAGVLDAIRTALEDTPTPRLRRDPPPSGEG